MSKFAAVSPTARIGCNENDASLAQLARARDL